MGKVRPDVRPSLRLRQSQKIKLPSEFENAKKNGHRVNSRSFTFNLMPRDGHTRLGLTVSKKTGDSPRRNRVKRLVREAFRLRSDLFPANCDVFVTARSACDVTCLADVIKEIESINLAITLQAQNDRSNLG